MSWRGPTSPLGNTSPNPINYNREKSESSRSNNRSHDVRRDVDTQKSFSITLHDIDTTIFNHLDKRVNPSVIAANVLTKVPVNYASPERWKSIEDDGYIRDRNGKIQCPVIAMRRSSMARNDNLITFNRHLQYPVVKTFSKKNQYDRFSVMSGFSPVREVYNVALPDHVIITYDFIVWTDYVEQANAVIEKINWSTEDYWGEEHGFKFRTSIADFQFQTEVPVEADRIIRTSFGMTCYAYLLPEAFESQKNVMQKSFTPRKIIVGSETVVNVSTTLKVAKTSRLNGDIVPLIDDSGAYPTSESVNSSYVNRNLLDYQVNLKEKTGSMMMSSIVYGIVSGSISGSVGSIVGELPIYSGISSGSSVFITGSFTGDVTGSDLLVSSNIYSGSGEISSPISGSVVSFNGSMIDTSGSLLISGSIHWTVDQSPGESTFILEDTIFNTKTATSKYQNLIVTVEGRSVPMAGVSHRTIGSNIVIGLDSGYLSFTPSTSSIAYAYGNIT